MFDINKYKNLSNNFMDSSLFANGHLEDLESIQLSYCYLHCIYKKQILDLINLEFIWKFYQIKFIIIQISDIPFSLSNILYTKQFRISKIPNWIIENFQFNLCIFNGIYNLELD